MSYEPGDVTLTNGVFVPARDREKAEALLKILDWYVKNILGQRLSTVGGVLWDLVGYVHGHDRELPHKYDETLKAVGIMTPEGVIPPSLQWAMVSICCRGEKLGEYADEKPRS